MEIRYERPEDHAAVEAMVRRAFWNKHQPGCDEYYLVHIMRDGAAYVPELSRVAEFDRSFPTRRSLKFPRQL